MPAYQQMGHHSENLLFAPELTGFAGAILSPTNNTPSEMRRHVTRCREDLDAGFDLLFDPQLYYPNTERGVLNQWDYFPTDVDTADPASDEWWSALIDRLLLEVQAIEPDAICSPVVVPRTFSDDFYRRSVDVAMRLKETLLPAGSRAVLTALVDPADLTTSGRPLAIASILTRGEVAEVYLIAKTDREPRREHTDTEGLKAVMRLIRALEDAGVRVTVGFSSSDLLLWKAAGATSCATGKFFNLRRFTSSRWEEPGGGGGQLAYWFEESLLAFLRESDLIRVRQQGMLSRTSELNPFLHGVDESVQAGTAWVGLGWRQFLWWFADAESRIRSGSLDVREALRSAENRWRELEDADVLMEEPRNDGSWIRPWRRALVEYSG